MSYKGLIIFGLLAAGCLQGNHNQNAGILTKEILIEENTIEESSTEENTIEESSTEKNATEEPSTEENATEEPSTGENSSEETSTEEEERIEGWIQKDDSKYYYEDGEMVTDWKKVEGNWYYFEPGGKMATGWKKVERNWYYFEPGGEMATGWKKIEGNWYYFEPGGEMATGWKKAGGNWYYLETGGKMATGWKKVGGNWYYFEPGGEMATGWKKVGRNWYYLENGGEMTTGWKKVEGNWYYLETSGKMATGWKKIEGNWYYLETGGKMATGWKKVGGNWYYLNIGGKMLTDWQQVDGKWYYLNSGGAMLKSTVVQGRVLDSNGEWMVDSKYIASNGSPYYIRVNKKACVVTVYALDENGYYTVPIKSMICSPGNSTPIGTFNTIVKYRWRNLIGNVQGQYSTRIVRGFLFHSVPYGTTNENDLRADYFNRLGEITSAGCVRLQVGDAKWIFDHCPLSTIVQIYENDMPGPFGVPNYIKIPTKGIFSHWDPTDPHQDNPWKRLSDGWNYIEGKWYYCYEDGSIAVNTVIDGYVVGQDGVWIP